MKRPKLNAFLAALILGAGFSSLPASAADGPPQVKLTLLGAGTLAAPFKQLNDEFMKKYPNVTVQAQFGGSVKMVKQVTELGQVADVVAVADYRVIPKYLFGEQGKPRYADWYAGFASNAVTFVYTPMSRFASEITPANWYGILSRPGVQIGRSNPDTDPSGYQTVQMLELAEKYYQQPGLAKAVLANAPRTNMRDTETELVAALQSGQIDYLAIYRSDALQHHFRYLELPSRINLGDAGSASFYAQASVLTRNGVVSGAPIVYAVTIPKNAAHPEWALKYVRFLLDKAGQKVMTAKGFGTIAPAYANDLNKVPADLKPLLISWPGVPHAR